MGLSFFPLSPLPSLSSPVESIEHVTSTDSAMVMGWRSSKILQPTPPGCLGMATHSEEGNVENDKVLSHREKDGTNQPHVA